MNIVSKIAKESTITFSGMMYGNINRYLYTALLARWVGVEYLGIYSLANAIMLIGEVIAKMGLETGVMRFVSRLDPETDKFQIQKIISFGIQSADKPHNSRFQTHFSNHFANQHNSISQGINTQIFYPYPSGKKSSIQVAIYIPIHHSGECYGGFFSNFAYNIHFFIFVIKPL
jgi:hypothetical protein